MRQVGVFFTALVLCFAPLIAWAVADRMWPGAAWFPAAAIWAAAGTFQVLQYLKTPGDGLDEVHDDDLRERVDRLAAELGSPSPTVLDIKGHVAAPVAHAAVGGLVHPAIMVSVTALRTLDQEPADAILAHEMAHLSTGAFWLSAGMWPLAGIVAVVSSIWIGAFGMLTGFAALRLGGVWIGRWIEIQCDRAGARATSHLAMAEALDSLHTEPPDHWATRAAWAVASHPPLEIRLDALRRDAPPEEQREILVDRPAVRGFRQIEAILYVAFVGTALGGSAVAVQHPAIGTAALFTASFGPDLVNLVAGQALARSIANQGELPPGDKRRWIGLTAALVGTYAVLFGGAVSELWMLLIVGGFALGMWGNRVRTNVLTPRMHFAEAMARGDVAGALAIAEKAVADGTTDPMMLSNRAYYLVVAGERDRGIEAAESLLAAYPRTKSAWLNLAVMYLDDDPAQTLAVLTRSDDLIEPDAVRESVRARALLRLDRAEAAYAVATAAVHRWPAYGPGCAAQALAAHATGRDQVARSAARRATDLQPNHTIVRIAAALLDQGNTVAEARDAAANLRWAFPEVDLLPEAQ